MRSSLRVRCLLERLPPKTSHRTHMIGPRSGSTIANRNTKYNRKYKCKYEPIWSSSPASSHLLSSSSCSSPSSSRFERGDIIEILETRPNGLWRGRCRGRVGTFKFVMVEVMIMMINDEWWWYNDGTISILLYHRTTYSQKVSPTDEPLQKCYQNLDGDDVNQICHGRGELAFERNWWYWHWWLMSLWWHVGPEKIWPR